MTVTSLSCFNAILLLFYPHLQELAEIKLFNKWSTDDVVVNDISLTDYIAVKEKFAKYLPHSAGRYAAKRFRKAQVSFGED